MCSTRELFRRVTGHRIRQSRQMLAWRQCDLAAACGVRQQVVSDWERGRRSVTSLELTVLCRALGCRLEALLRPFHDREEPLVLVRVCRMPDWA